MRALPIIVLVLAVLAVGAGWLTTPRYRPPAEADEERLMERAVAYYKASRLLQYEAMCQMYTPARQLAEAEALRSVIDERQATRRALADKTIENLQFSADSVSAEHIELKVEGDWAVAGGTYMMAGESGTFPLPLEDTVWVRDAGDWWIYSLKFEELNAYGNPPDFARQKLQLRDPLLVEQETAGQ
jgi:hypothetical protein